MVEIGAEIDSDGSHESTPRTGGALERIASLNRYHFGQTIYFQDAQADYWYRIVSGAARECVLTSDGRRQVVDFLFPGDLFGFSSRGVRRLAGEIIVESTMLACYPRFRAEALAESDPQVARRVRQMAFGAIERLQARTVLLGRNNPLEKVSSFLLEMATRSAANPGELIPLPMTRYDIADYLALAVETVSRTLTSLRHQGAIHFLGARRVQIVDRELLFKLGATAAPGARGGRSFDYARHDQTCGSRERAIDSHQCAPARPRHDHGPARSREWRDKGRGL
jgi:CRP-like cAMP-binding protein